MKNMFTLKGIFMKLHYIWNFPFVMETVVI